MPSSDRSPHHRREHRKSTSHHEHGRRPAYLHFLIIAPLVLLTFFFGGARPWIWLSVIGLFLILLAPWQFRHGLSLPEKSMRPVFLFFSAFLAVPLLQLLPLPDQLLGLISPVREQWAQAVAQFGAGTSSTLSYAPLETWMGLAWWAFLLVYALLLHQALSSRATHYPIWLLHALFFLAGFEALYGILQTLIPSLGVLWDISPGTGLAGRGYARGTFINRNHFAAFLGLLWPVLLSYLLILKSPRKMEHLLGKRERAQVLMQKKAVGIFCLGLVILGLVFSQSRGGILAALLSFTLLYFFAGLRQRRVAIGLAACWIVMIAYGGIIGFDGIISRFLLTEQGAAGRMEVWKDGWTVTMDHPLSGTGLGTYDAASRAYQNAAGPTRRAQHAHNDYLEAATEMGLPAATVLTLGVWGLWWRQALFLWHRRKSMDRDHLVLATGSLAALCGYLLHIWVEFNNAIPANQLTALLVALFHFSVAKEAIPEHEDAKTQE